MQLPENVKTREVFIGIFQATISGNRFSPIEVIKDLGYQDHGDLTLVEALSQFRYYCIVYGPNEWQVRPMVVHKYQIGYYDKFGI